MEVKIICPECNANLVKVIEPRGGVSNGNEILKDRCPECGKLL